MKFGWLPFCLEWGPSSRPYLRSIRKFLPTCFTIHYRTLDFCRGLFIEQEQFNYSINIFEGFQNPNVTLDSFTLINTNMQNEFPFILLSILELGHIHINFYHPPFIVCLARKATPTSSLSSSKKFIFFIAKSAVSQKGVLTVCLKLKKNFG